MNECQRCYTAMFLRCQKVLLKDIMSVCVNTTVVLRTPRLQQSLWYTRDFKNERSRQNVIHSSWILSVRVSQVNVTKKKCLLWFPVICMRLITYGKSYVLFLPRFTPVVVSKPWSCRLWVFNWHSSNFTIPRLWKYIRRSEIRKDADSAGYEPCECTFICSLREHRVYVQ